MISILCPTRNRPMGVARLAGSAWDLAADEDDVELVFYQDDDAPGSVPPSLAELDGVVVVTGPRITLSDMWNKCAEKASGDILMQCGDDIVFRTEGWDRLVIDAFESYPDRIALVYGRDGIFDQDLASHGFTHRRWSDTLGYFTPPMFSSDYGDAWRYEIAKSLGRLHFLPDLYTEHFHPVAGKAIWDGTHQERLARHEHDDVKALWESLEATRTADAGKLRVLLGTPG